MLSDASYDAFGSIASFHASIVKVQKFAETGGRRFVDRGSQTRSRVLIKEHSRQLAFCALETTPDPTTLRVPLRCRFGDPAIVALKIFLCQALSGYWPILGGFGRC